MSTPEQTKNRVDYLSTRTERLITFACSAVRDYEKATEKTSSRLILSDNNRMVRNDFAHDAQAVECGSILDAIIRTHALPFLQRDPN